MASAYYSSPPPAYSSYPCPPQVAQLKIVDQGKKLHSYYNDQRDDTKYNKSKARAMAVYQSAANKNYLPCPARGCSNVYSNLNDLILELHVHEVSSTGTLCPTCANWFETWDLKDRHICPGPGGNVPDEDPTAPPPDWQSWSRVDPTFFHQMMPRQQSAIVAARRALEIRRAAIPGKPLQCNFHNCGQFAPTEAALAEHLFKHFTTAAGGLCAACNTWCADRREREGHQCREHSYSEIKSFCSFDSKPLDEDLSYYSATSSSSEDDDDDESMYGDSSDDDSDSDSDSDCSEFEYEYESSFYGFR